MKTLKTHTRSLTAVLFFVLVFGSACIRFHQMPRQQQLGSHLVRIRPDCDGATTGSVTQTGSDGTTRIVSYEFTCGDTKVEIHDNTLVVNGKSYGSLDEGDQVAVDYGKVRVNLEVRTEAR